jgi:RecB family exonuclease
MELPGTLVLAGFEAPAPIETALFECLEKSCALKCLHLAVGTPVRVLGVTLPSRKQEVAWLTTRLVSDAQHIPLNRIGVVIPDTSTYLPHVKQAFTETLGDPLDNNGSAFNISAGSRLVDRPLVQAGILPLRFWVEGQSRALLLSMILSPYYARWARKRDYIARADCLWRKEGVDCDFKTLVDVVSDRSPELWKLVNGPTPGFETTFCSFQDKSTCSGAKWVDKLETYWESTGFPVISSETDRGAWGHFKAILYMMREDLDGISMDAAEFTSFLRYLLSEEIVHTRGSEEAGIQVLGLIESRGMSFEKLYVLGLAAGSLPRPVRPLPFLSPGERHGVQGATVESQHGFAEEAFGHLLACAPHVSLIRPQAEGDEPLAPSPFWLQAVCEEMPQVVDFWSAPDAVSLRAAWLRGVHRGLKDPRPFPPVDPPINGDCLPGVISASELSKAFACPFRFFAESVLKVFPLEEFMVGVSPKDRGSLLHKTLSRFTQRCRQKGLLEQRDRAAMVQLLKECVNEVVATVTAKGTASQTRSVAQHAWIMEGSRWMTKEGEVSGLLVRWLDLELQRLREGWLWMDEESSFEQLGCADWPFSISGRIDRIDYHKEKGLMLWDYKSGEHPSRRAVVESFMAPQIPAYILHVKGERAAETKEFVGAGVPVSGGYISLKRASTICHQALTPKGSTWDDVLERWQEAVARLGTMLILGLYRAEPYPVSSSVRKDKVCQYCSYRPLCARREIG